MFFITFLIVVTYIALEGERQSLLFPFFRSPEIGALVS